MQRSKFALSLKFIQPMTGLIRTGWKLYAHRQSPFNAAMSYTIDNAVMGAYPNYSIDPGKVMISRGALTPALNATAAENGNLVFSWVDNSGVNAAKATDKTLIAIINLAKGEAVTDNAGAERATGSQAVVIPADWSGDDVHVYLGFISEDGKEVSNSVYVGSISIA
jgi:hypothetical protein